MASTVIAIGDELVGGFTTDTNSGWMAERLRLLGFPVKRITAVRDRKPEIVEQLGRDLADPEVADVFCSGGLGPTPDDRTFEAMALALNRPLMTWEPVQAKIVERVRQLHALGRLDSPEPNEGNLRMAKIPAGPAQVFANRVGMAPGVMYALQDGRRLFVLPGVPRELRTIFLEEIEPTWLVAGQAEHMVEIAFEGIPEAAFYPIMQEVEARYPEVRIGSYPDVERRFILTIRCQGREEAAVLAAADLVRERAGRLARP